MSEQARPWPTIERIRELYNYDPLTGIFTRAKAIGSGTRLGQIAGSDGGQGYLVLSADYHRILAHRVAWAHYYGEWPKLVIDHIDGNGHNNAIANLRDVNHRTNSANMLRNKAMRADAAKWRAYQDSLTAEAAPAGKVASGRTAKDYAIEHAEYMAACSERLIDAVNDLAMAEQERDEGTANPSDVKAAQDTLREFLGTMRNRIYEFRKRRDRATPATEPAAPGYVSERAAIYEEIAQEFDRRDNGAGGFYEPDEPAHIIRALAAASTVQGKEKP